MDYYKIANGVDSMIAFWGETIQGFPNDMLDRFKNSIRDGKLDPMFVANHFEEFSNVVLDCTAEEFAYIIVESVVFGYVIINQTPRESIRKDLSTSLGCEFRLS